MNNAELVQQVVFALKDLKIQEIIVCAGARNIPIVEFLENYNQSQKEKFQMTSFFEERSAAFYALGRVKASSRPVAVVTTSGTAAIETYAAVVEAYYQALPLVIITADRPKSYRGSGAPQAIEQAGLFQKYCEQSVDWDCHEKQFLINFNNQRPFHFNVCFDEPLIDQLKTSYKKKHRIQTESQKFHFLPMEPRKLNPLVIVSELNPMNRDLVIRFLKENKLYFVAESLSGIKNLVELKNQELGALFFSLSNQESIRFCQDNFDSIIRIGGIPTLRLWRDLEYDLKNFLVLSFSERNFSGLARLSRVYPIKELSRLKVYGRKNISLEFLNIQLDEERTKLLKKYKNSEQNFFRVLSEVIGSDPLYLGNSLPIREWDEFSAMDQKNQSIYGNRGANGIDGQVSTYLGWARDLKRSWCVIGDLTAMYDLAALTMKTTAQQTQKRIVIVNNSGGQIFSRLFKNQKYLNRHEVKFKNWAEMFGWDYYQVKNLAALHKIPKLKNIVIEIKINNKFSEQYKMKSIAQVKKILTTVGK